MTDERSFEESNPETETPSAVEWSAADTDTALQAVLDAAPTDDAPVLLELTTGEWDIDSALAAIANLPDLTRDETATEEETAEPIDPPAMPMAEDTPEQTETLPIADAVPQFTTFARPPQMQLQRGQAASVVPAVFLMAVGGWLTYMAVNGTSLPSLQLVALAGGGLGVMLLAQWFSAQRWTRGSFFVGTLLLLGSGILLVLSQPNGLGLRGYPFFVVALGVALLLSGLVAPPRNGRLVLLGLAIALAGAGLYLLNNAPLAPEIFPVLTDAAPFILGIAALILVVPLVRRR